jgi:hypothetical protein
MVEADFGSENPWPSKKPGDLIETWWFKVS